MKKIIRQKYDKPRNTHRKRGYNTTAAETYVVKIKLTK